MIDLLVLPDAELDLFEIRRFSIESFGMNVARRYLDDIEDALDRLLDHPESGPVYPGIRPAIRFISVGKHRLFYDCEGTTISIVRVLHQAMVPENHL